ncbi:hypothetical protein ABF179_002227 [Flavobacterium psychrophilum]
MILTSIDFIIKELKSLHNKFTNSNIRYEFCKSSNTHLVEVTPFEFYNSETYMEAELDFEDLFSDNFPNEDLVFISEQSLSKISDPIFEIFSEKSGFFRTDFIVYPYLSSFVDFCEDDYQSMGENTYALAA